MIIMEELAQNIARIITERDCKLIAIDGRCGSGKTTLSGEIQKLIPCNIIHMDHFFLPPERRTPERFSTPGENVDHERLLTEVLLPLQKGEKVSYRPFDCQTMSFGKPIELVSQKITIIEGSYSCHPSLYGYYDLHIFLSVSAEEQMKRIILRNGNEKAKVFASRWIPLEEAYFQTFRIAQKCEYHFDT